jgi:Glycosyltransferase 61
MTAAQPITKLRSVIRREKWRLRWLKQLVLPLRSLKRQIAMLCRTITRKPAPRIEKSTTDYLIAQTSGRVNEVFPTEAVQPLPHPLEDNSNGGFPESAYVFELRDIVFWGRYGGSVVTRDNHLLADLSPEVWGIENHPIFSSLRLPKAQPLGGRTAIVVTPEAPANYYHWLLDLLPRVALIRETAKNFENFERILINGSHAPYEQPSLAAFGVPANKLIYVDAHDRFRVASAIIPSMDHSSKIVAPWKLRALCRMRDAVVGSDISTPSRIYISRKSAAVRRVLNETDLASALHEAGFTMIELEPLPWSEQVRLFSNATVVLAPHGAALANIAFCRSNTVVAEIATRAGYRDFYLRLAASGSFRYHFIEAQPRTEPRAASTRAFENEDMILSEQALKNFLREL